ncbi:hypothetical protein QQ020_20335 [Fulvivirgaceae bacterium BMA12]|uniref:DUF6787 domain-containing protein n=1 Tax=Agaribacillus aureus TaxID=3051825 RepID=A0ABT8L9L8_9BACT|nr:hypothetical protein [Fulvivirgaceae bacterium BMA12]
MEEKNFFEKLKKRWQLNSLFQVVVVLLVFACTGFTVLFLKRPILGLLGEEARNSILYSFLYYLLILPLYQVVLLVYAFLFGQFKFFWAFEKRFFKRMQQIFTGKKDNSQ